MQYLEIYVQPETLDEVFKTIEQGLDATGPNEREYFKVCVFARGYECLNIDDLRMGMMRINDKLQRWKGLDDAISCKIIDSDEFEGRNDQVDAIANVLRASKVNVNTFTLDGCKRNYQLPQFLITVTNDGCKLNGYSEPCPWLIQTENLQDH